MQYGGINLPSPSVASYANLNLGDLQPSLPINGIVMRKGVTRHRSVTA
jgi:hypothetical protein